MKKLRALVLVHEDLVPPDSMEGYTDKEIIEWKTEYDVITTLREMGHEVHPLGVHDDLGVIRKAILEWKPHIAFNLLEEFHGHSLFDYHVASYLELMQQHYTGCNPRGLMLAHDKALSKKLLSFHRINIPRFAVIPIGKRPKKPSRLKFPLFVKSLCEEGSYGIAQASVVQNEDKLGERVTYLHEQLGTPVLVEEYIEGRELYLSIIGNNRLQTFPLIELQFGKAPDDMQKIATSRVKWDWEYQKKYGIDTVLARGIPETTRSRIARLGKRIFRILSLTGYARLDLRMTDEGRLFVLEANANPDIGYGEELSCATEATGMSYEALLQRVMNLGMRYDPRTRVS
ncbi:MAG TPA: D-alanine--D-alanine ligase [Gammaproteobacteria bacterium]|nr:D-alanine--D-alanine ligase [Gammaproteobacteria bacterium]